MKRRTLGGHYSHAHIDGAGRMRKQAHRDKIDTRLRVAADILQSDASGALKRNATFQPRTELHGLSHGLRRHVVEQDGLTAVGQHLLQLFKRTYFDLYGLRPAAIVKRSLDRGHNSSSQCDMVVLDEHAVG